MQKYSFTTLFSTFTLILILSACGSTPKAQRPLWIDAPETHYSNEQYLSAVGQASKRDRAGRSAQANLAQIFSVTINENSQYKTQVTSTNNSTEKQEQLQEELIRNISTSTQHKLDGVEIKETWQSPKGEYYALAVLDKQKAAQGLIRIINEADEATLKYIESSKIASNFIQSFHALIKAKNEQLSRENANHQLSILSTSRPAEINSKDIDIMIFKALSSLQVSSQAESINSAQALQAALNQVGISYSKNAAISLNSKLDLSKANLKEGWYWLRGSYELDFVQDGNVISRKRWPVKVSAKDTAQLDTRLRDKINKKLPTYIFEILSSPPSL